MPITLESKSSDILSPYYMPNFFSYLRTLLLGIVLWSKLLYRNLSRYAGINIIENMVDDRSLSTDEITNSHTELYFHLKKLDQNKIKLPLCKYIKEKKKFPHCSSTAVYKQTHQECLYKRFDKKAMYNHKTSI